MPKAAAESVETKPKAPAFLQVGVSNGTGRARVKVGEQHLRKLFDWWNAMAPALKEKGGDAVGVPALKFAEELGLSRPSNGNSFRANLQRVFDDLNIDGKTMFLSLRGAGENRFEVLPTTMIWFHPVAAAERRPLGTQGTSR